MKSHGLEDFYVFIIFILIQAWLSLRGPFCLAGGICSFECYSSIIYIPVESFQHAEIFAGDVRCRFMLLCCGVLVVRLPSWAVDGKILIDNPPFLVSRFRMGIRNC